MQQLRPDRIDAQDFIARWQRQARAGFRLQENLVHGVHWFVDDLVTDAAARRAGLGRLLMAYLKAEACRCGCQRLVLDTPLGNALGHRFYFRNGLLARALRFSIDLDPAGSTP